VSMSFVGPLGVAFPQFRPDVDSFDDRMRKRPDKIEEVDEDAQDNEGLKQAISTIPGKQSMKQAVQQAPPQAPPPKPPTPAEPGAEHADVVDEPNRPPPPEFTEAEIKAAFEFIDLDHNSYVGAKEIRHILGLCSFFGIFSSRLIVALCSVYG
jgi:uncharacterized membrane protein